VKQVFQDLYVYFKFSKSGIICRQKRIVWSHFNRYGRIKKKGNFNNVPYAHEMLKFRAFSFLSMNVKFYVVDDISEDDIVNICEADNMSV